MDEKRTNSLVRSKQIVIFAITIVAVVALIVILSIIFSSFVPKDNNQGNSNTTTSSSPATTNIIPNNSNATSTLIPLNIQSDINNIKTISGNTFDPTKIPYRHSKWVIIRASELNNPLTIDRCLSLYKDNVKALQDPDSIAPKDFKDQVIEGLKKIDVSYDGNTFDYGLDSSC